MMKMMATPKRRQVTSEELLAAHREELARLDATTQPDPAVGEGQWYEARTGNHQGLIVEEGTGRNVATVYDKADVPRIVTAVNHHAQLVAVLEQFIAIYPPNARRHPDVAIAIADAEAVLATIRQAPQRSELKRSR